MKVKCIEGIYNDDLCISKGEVYEAYIEIYNKKEMYCIKIPGESWRPCLPKKYFVNLQELRDKKLEELGI